MSAYICSDRHIASIAMWAAMESAGKLKDWRDMAQEIADALKRENIKSVNHRYSERTRFKKCDLSTADVLPPEDVVALCDCLDYQSCEHHDYKPGMLAVIRASAFRASGGRKSDLWSI